MASVTKLPSGKWRAYGNYKDDTGKRRLKSFIDADKNTALRAARAFEDEMRGLPGMTISRALDAYITAKSPALSQSTIRAYTYMANALKTRYASFLALILPSQKQAQTFVNELSAEMKPKAVKNYVGLISSAIRFTGGTFPQVSLPKWELRSDFIPSEADMHRISAAVAGTKLEIPVALGILGLRRSEICGLSPSDLDGNVLHIHTAVVLGSDLQHHTKATKTERSDRRIILPDVLAEKVAGWTCEMTPMAITHAFRKVAARLGIQIRFHDLRHYFVSYCHNVLRLTDAQIMALGGWSTDSVMKRHYRQAMHEKEAAETVAAAFGNMFCNMDEKNAVK